ncbi:MAG: hypothetical protein K0S00_565 [Xanthobacteraceae bacterium]|nr:hypothetical protein [Xanthobacteraceae bacterium]
MVKTVAAPLENAPEWPDDRPDRVRQQGRGAGGCAIAMQPANLHGWRVGQRQLLRRVTDLDKGHASRIAGEMLENARNAGKAGLVRGQHVEIRWLGRAARRLKRLVDEMEELMKFTLLTRDRTE